MSNLNKAQFNVPIPEGTNIKRSGGIGHIEGDPERSTTKMVPISTVERYKEYDRTGREAHPQSEGDINKLAEELRNGGVIREPLYLSHSTEHQWAYLAEGHHRLEAARRAGLSHVPLTIHSSESSSSVAHNKEKGKGAPLTLTSNFGNFPGDTYQPPNIHPDHFRELK